MRVLQFVEDGEIHLGLATPHGVLDLTAEAEAKTPGAKTSEVGTPHAGLAKVPANMADLMALGDNGLRLLRDLQKSKSAKRLAEDSLDFAPVVTNPGKILCIGWNYLSHIEETKSQTVLPEYPEVFGKCNNTLLGHRKPVRLPPAARLYDYEAELVIVIGKKCCGITEEDAKNYIFGYTCGNDVSARDLQNRNTQWFLGKSLDGFAPVGPYIAIGNDMNPSNLGISLRRNGVTVQESNTCNMVFNCYYLVSYLSQYLTLQPGDLIFTGTPSGVILGMEAEQRNWLTPGETMAVCIEGIGELVNYTV